MMVGVGGFTIDYIVEDLLNTSIFIILFYHIR